MFNKNILNIIMNKIENNKINSPLKTGLKNIAGRLSTIINNKIPYIKPNYITTFGLILHAFGLLNLLKYEFGLFVILFCASYFCDILDGIYARKFNQETKIGKLYDKFADWLRLLTAYTIFSSLYKKHITVYNILLILGILCLCNFHFVLKKSIKNYEKHKPNIDTAQNKPSVISQLFREDNFETVQTVCIDLWVGCFKKLEIKTMKKLINFTRYFDESMVILYLVLMVCYINYKKTRI